MLFSGGLDTAILATLNPEIIAITVSLESRGADIQYAKLVAKNLKLSHFHIAVSTDEAMEAIPRIITILKSFDPAIPNDIVVYFGLKTAKEWGIREIMTGDGSDELLAGYDFMKEMENLDEYIRRIAHNVSFSSNIFGNFFDIKIKQPYLDKEFIDFSLNLSREVKIKQQNHRVWGKWILRKAFEKTLPANIIWQNKRPLEYGSDMKRLRGIITSKISDEEFEQKNKLYPIKFMNKEHLYYYEIYRKEVGEVLNAKEGQKKCLGCGTGMKEEAFHCRVCGWVESIKWLKK